MGAILTGAKVFVDFMIYFCNSGRENLRDIEKSDVADEESQGGRIYKTGKISKNLLL